MGLVFSGKQEVYLEIAERYERYILEGIYQNGDKLPSVRHAAGEMGVNPNTVAKAYTLLEEKGYIRALPKKGAFVIYNGRSEASESDAAKDFECREAIIALKTQGITLDEIIRLAKEVFENDQN